MSGPKQLRGTAVREKLIGVAAELFYAKGTRAVGIDEVIRESGMSKASLYRWFDGKDALVLAVLQRRDDLFWAQWDRIAEQYPAQPEQQLRAQLAWMQRLATTDGYRGCAFVNTAAEFDAAHTAIRDRCERHEARLGRRLRALVDGMRVRDPEALAEQLQVAIVGAFAIAGVTRGGGPAHQLGGVTDALIAAARA